MSKRIVVITSGRFPEGEPGSIRINMICKSLVEEGYEIIVLCRGNANEKKIVSNGISYYSLRSIDNGKFKKIYDYCRFSNKVKKTIISLGKIECLYIYNAPISIFKWSKKYSIQNDIKLVHDCVEWYSSEEFRFGKLNPIYRFKNYINTKVIDKNFKIIAISNYLKQYFMSKGIESIRIPMLCDISEFNMVKKVKDDKLHLFYAGTPAKKDLIGNVIKALTLLPKDKQKRVEFMIIGCNEDYLVKNCEINYEIINEVRHILQFSERIPREEVIKRMSIADFIVIPRDASLRYAKAGFPSKVVEGLANSTPILCNYSSDLNKYLEDGKNAIVAVDHSPKELAVAIERALDITPKMKLYMQEEALKTAVKYFDFRCYSKKLGLFLK
ncbi:glycosyltransferase [Clostridium perfringens]|uniref:glycosyltransferase n=1 Tax=Clostridium perfringens TaxID=1502 RepID=UPI0018E46028|nr:glycosyltransferase [Clostridium perfringens]ELC8413678.1 glycosyltransferase [Clostridium perfringens]MBI6007229.1 glycosyltransferase [Clostridium perfringens]MDM0605558.1 glycosyltransferase [Clostridium perfringens]MDM0638772.1 glycosyltransferase [Clostridium perfringens]HAT4166206.1 glycosyltransferase family 4 protein [Clostridium perfringens]